MRRGKSARSPGAARSRLAKARRSTRACSASTAAYRWHKLRLQPIFDDARVVTGACGIVMDIDDFVKAGEAYEIG